MLKNLNFETKHEIDCFNNCWDIENNVAMET